MKFLDMYFGIFSEGADDAKHRATALDVERRLSAALQGIKESDVRVIKAAAPTAAVDIGELVDDYRIDVELHFVARKESKGSGKRGSFTGSRIILYVDVPSEAFEKITPEIWKKIVVKNASSVLERSREIFWHEFIHYLDSERIDPSSRQDVISKAADAGSGTKKDPVKYFNNPIEFNAFLQAGLTRVEDHLTKVGSWDEAQKLMGGSADEFYKIVMKVIPPQMRKFMNDKYRNKAKKRIAQMWVTVKSRYGGKKNV